MHRPGRCPPHLAARSENRPHARWPGASRPSIEPCLAGWTRLEALVQPVILFGHRHNLLLDECIHAPRILFDAGAGEIVPRRMEAGDIAATAWQLTRDT